MRLSVAYDFLPKTATVRASCVMDHFGIGLEQGRHVIADGLELPLQPGQISLFTGPSGSGKSSLMRAAADELGHSRTVLDLNRLTLGDELLIDSIPLTSTEALQLLAQCGLGEARLLLRRPSELSDGQQYRFRLALGIAQKPGWLVADEFTATLDRTLAKVIAFNIRRLADRTGIGFLLATTHDDVAEDLAPELHVRCGLDGKFDVQPREPSPETPPPPGRKKKESASSRTCGSASRPVATGRTSLGGITAATNSR